MNICNKRLAPLPPPGLLHLLLLLHHLGPDPETGATPAPVAPWTASPGATWAPVAPWTASPGATWAPAVPWTASPGATWAPAVPWTGPPTIALLDLVATTRAANQAGEFEGEFDTVLAALEYSGLTSLLEGQAISTVSLCVCVESRGAESGDALHGILSLSVFFHSKTCGCLRFLYFATHDTIL